MYNKDTDLLFPPRLIPVLRNLRGECWRELVDAVSLEEPTSLDRLAFELFMIRLGGCTSCHADSFRALRGCTICAQQTLQRFRGSDQELLVLYGEARGTMEQYLERPN